ncbi:MAG: hypothetical protein ACHQT9_03455 [Candidatus Saccharimonadales bacterium]
MSKNSIEIIRPFIAGLGEEHDLQVIGGVGSFVLKNPAAEILVDEQLVIAPPDEYMDYSDIGQFRKDGNRRDFDVLVRSSSPEEIGAVEELAQETIGRELELSVFGLHTIAQLDSQRAHPVQSLAKVWVADRYVSEEDGQIVDAKKALFPFAVDIDFDSLETWHLMIGNDKPIPIPHPGTVVLNYLTRSVSGLRPKDADKIEELGLNVFKKAPELVDWIVDGPGRTQIDLARVFHSLREPKDGQTLVVGGRLEVSPYPCSVLTEHPAMLVDGDERLAKAAIAVSRFKARTLHTAESQEAIVTAFQRYVERYLGFITGNH